MFLGYIWVCKKKVIWDFNFCETMCCMPNRLLKGHLISRIIMNDCGFYNINILNWFKFKSSIIFYCQIEELILFFDLTNGNAARIFNLNCLELVIGKSLLAIKSIDRHHFLRVFNFLFTKFIARKSFDIKPLIFISAL